MICFWFDVHILCYISGPLYLSCFWLDVVCGGSSYSMNIPGRQQIMRSRWAMQSKQMVSRHLNGRWPKAFWRRSLDTKMCGLRVSSGETFSLRNTSYITQWTLGTRKEQVDEKLPILFYNTCSIIKFAEFPFYSSVFYVHFHPATIHEMISKTHTICVLPVVSWELEDPKMEACTGTR